jgi:hypothetical protein
MVGMERENRSHKGRMSAWRPLKALAEVGRMVDLIE